MVFASYNCGKGYINQALKKGRELEEIFYNTTKPKETRQGAWSTYESVIKIMRKYDIISEGNCDINERYIDFIFMI